MKRKLFVLLPAVFLMLCGTVVFLISFYAHDTINTPVIYHVRSDFQRIEIDLDDTDLIVVPAETTYIEIVGYRESQYHISESDGKLMLTDRNNHTDQPIKLSGIGRYIKESENLSGEKSIILHLASEHLHSPVSMVLNNTSMTLLLSLDYLTLHAQNSTISADDFSFMRLDAELYGCETHFSFVLDETNFSRNVETHNTKLSINGDERANTEKYSAETGKPSLVLHATGGVCELIYAKSDSKAE